MITTGDKQNQSAGNNSQQLQAQNMTVIVGIDDKRAREIFQEMNLQMREDYSAEALKIASCRVIEFEDRLMPKMEAVEGALEAFADPSFQRLVVEAQKVAASSERPADYDLLAELLIHRFQKGENRIARAGITRAVEIVDKIADDALLALTTFHAITAFVPLNGNIEQGFSILDSLFNKIVYSKLPIDNEWVDHLEILNAIRLTPFSGRVSIENHYIEMLEGYVAIGIKKDSENFKKAIDILKISNLPTDIFLQHEFNDNYYRLNIVNRKAIDNITLMKKDYYNLVPTQTQLTNSQKEAIKSIYDLYDKDENLKQVNLKKFGEKWRKFPHLRDLLDWTNTQNLSFQITSVGKVLAHSNAQRCDQTLPAMD